MKTHWLFLSFIALAFAARTQDLVLNNYDLSPVQLNPALSGNACGTRAGANMQSNVGGIGETYVSLQGSIDAPIKLKKQWKLGVGYRYFRDISGEAKFGIKSHFISTSVTKTVEKENVTHNFSFGLEGGFSNRTLNALNLRWPNQIGPNGFNPTLPAGEPDLDINVSFLDMNAGIHYRAKWNAKHELNMGIAFNHFNTPNISFLGNETPLTLRNAYYLQGMYMISPKLGLAPSVFFTHQKPHSTYYVSLGAQYALVRDRTFLTVTGGYQKNNRPFVGLQLRHKNLSLGANYTLTNSIFGNKLETYLTYTFGNYACN